MAITGYDITRAGRIVYVTVTSDLSGTVYYHWYLDGSWVAYTVEPTYVFVLETDSQAEIICQDTNDAAYDYVANAPAGWPATKTLFWTASTSTDVDHYRVEQKKDSDAWVELGTVDDDGSWSYQYETPTLEDLASYQWKITPVDTAGNDGTAVTLGPETVVRRPDGPRYEIAYSAGTQRVSYSEAS
jgi:hypothetical protein